MCLPTFATDAAPAQDITADVKFATAMEIYTGFLPVVRTDAQFISWDTYTNGGDADSASGADELLFAVGFRPDAVVLDPPRRGCDAALLHSLDRAEIGRIIYISCNPATLARDAAVLCRLGYLPGDAQPVDLFPRTGHVETVCLFTKSDS